MCGQLINLITLGVAQMSYFDKSASSIKDKHIQLMNNK